jgi:hypothetical protein
LKRRSGSLSWTLLAAPVVAACTLGPTTRSFEQDEDAAVPHLTLDSGVAPACVNLECNRTTCSGGQKTTLSGTVYDPAGQSPLYNAIVYVPNGPVAQFSQGVSCDHCGAVASGDPIASTLSDVQGKFILNDVPVADDLPVVLQIGRWRRQITIPHVVACIDNPVPPDLTHMPRSRHEGNIPLTAIVTGGFDPLECLLRKIGIDDAEFTGSDGEGRIHLYEGYGGGGVPSSQPSLTLYPQLDRYDAVILACEGDTYPENKPFDATYAMLDYLDKGGRVYASHFEYYWFAPYPDGAGVVPLPSVARWAQRGAMGDVVQANVNTSFPKGQAYFDWLTQAGAIGPDGLMTVQQARHDVDYAVQPLSEGWLRTTLPQAILMLPFNTPVNAPDSKQCGRAVFSDMHVASEDVASLAFPAGCVTQGLSSQEKALEFMLFDLASCIQDDSQPPVAPSPPLK